MMLCHSGRKNFLVFLETEAFGFLFEPFSMLIQRLSSSSFRDAFFTNIIWLSYLSLLTIRISSRKQKVLSSPVRLQTIAF